MKQTRYGRLATVKKLSSGGVIYLFFLCLQRSVVMRNGIESLLGLSVEVFATQRVFTNGAMFS
jgi:hypothetical protein